MVCVIDKMLSKYFSALGRKSAKAKQVEDVPVPE
jgi:hypothetical protein